jgi:hypothetical protein
MTDSLTQLVAKLQAKLLGDSTTFLTATFTSAIQQALLKLNLAIPQRATVITCSVWMPGKNLTRKNDKSSCVCP